MSIFSRIFRTFCRISSPRGFTLVELLVVVSIVIIITAFVLVRHSRFDSSTLLRSLSYSVALSMRQAQVYGTSVRGFLQSGTYQYAPGYGVYFSTSLGCNGIPNTCYALFADVNGDQSWNEGETVSTPILGRTFTIKSFCAVTAAGASSCYTNDNNAGNDAISSLVIYFRRPNPEASIYTSPAGPAYSYAYVEIQSSADSGARSVKVTSVGQITVCGLNADLAAC
ncbi:MAG: prepilin-type N-terminal cleavage/methylation domain-containing protein [Patescibacteria group bacterium]